MREAVNKILNQDNSTCNSTEQFEKKFQLKSVEKQKSKRRMKKEKKEESSWKFPWKKQEKDEKVLVKSEPMGLPSNLLENVFHDLISLRKNISILLEEKEKEKFTSSVNFVSVIFVSIFLGFLGFFCGQSWSIAVFPFLVYWIFGFQRWKETRWRDFVEISRRKSSAELFETLPKPLTQANKEFKLEIESESKTEKKDLDLIWTELMQTLPSNCEIDFKTKLKRALMKEIELDKDDIKKLFEMIKDKEIRKKWSENLFHQVKDRTKSTRSKEEKMKYLLEIHENSTLNKERGLNHIILMRKFLQNPAEGKSTKFISIQFAIETIETVEELLKHPSDDPISVLSLEFLVGTYALYGK